MTALRTCLIVLSLALLTACQPDLNSNSYNYYDGTSSRVQKGVIQDIQYNVKVRKNSGVGTLAGAVAGGALGSALGRSNSRANVVGAVGGAIAGGLAGSAIENSASNSQGTLYIVKLKPSGQLLSVIQNIKSSLCKGDHVYLIGSRQRPRLTLDDSYYNSGQHHRRRC